MKDNLSIVITIIVLVLLMVIFPLYNFFERQDDMSYNLVLKATTNFVDQVINNGYIDQSTYDKFVTELGNTGNVYDIQIEAHRKVLTNERNTDDNSVYVEQSYIDYNDDIFNIIEDTNTSNLMKKSLKNNIYLFNPKDEIYVKVKNSNMTMAGSLFNVIVPASNKTRISVDYGGIIKNNAWKIVDATYTGHKLAPGAPTIYLDYNDHKDETKKDEVNEIPKVDLVDHKLVASATSFEGRIISKYCWKVSDNDDTAKVRDGSSDNGGLDGLGDFWEIDHKYKVEVYVIDSEGYRSDTTTVQIKVVSGAAQSIESPSEERPGLLNNDDEINNEDIMILEKYLNHEIIFSNVQNVNADIDDNGTINQRDLEFLREIVQNGYILGDINNDNNVDVNDLIMLQNHVNNITRLTDDEIKRADMNKDNVIDSLDSVLMNNKVST